MRRYGAVLLFVLAIVGIGTATSVIRRQNPPAHPIRTQKQVNQDQWPAVDYDSPVAQKKPGKASGKPKKTKYEQSPMMVNPFDEGEQTTITHGEADSMPALPLGQSAVVLIGQVTEAKSYLSADKTGVYSEFTIHAGEVPKNIGESPITPGSSLPAQRAGGRVRFPSGGSHLYSVAKERMPLVGKRYLFFLKRHKGEETFGILTGYELSDGVVIPLDQHEQFRGLKGKGEVSLLDAIRNLASASQN